MATLAARSLVLIVSIVTAGVSLLVAPPASSSSQQATAGWRAISAGDSHTCGIRTTGRLYCWGYNGFGQLGNGSKDDAYVPVQVSGNRTDWKAVSTGTVQTCALRTTGRLFCWGSNLNGALGTGGGDDATVPTQVSGKRTDWRAPTVGGEHACALRASSRLFCWGENGDGQVGDGTEEDRFVPREVKGAWTNWTQVSAGVSHTCGRRASGRAYCWGFGSDGQIGDGAELPRLAPRQVAGDRTDWASVAAGYYHSCGRRTTGRVFCWGDNGSGQLGVGTPGGALPSPTQVAGERTDWAAVATGLEHTCARRSSGRLFCWGRNGSGQVGNGGGDDVGSPTEVSGGSTAWRGFSLGGGHTCALRSTQRAYCWGSNFSGQLGDNKSSSERLVPNEIISP